MFKMANMWLIIAARNSRYGLILSSSSQFKQMHFRYPLNSGKLLTQYEPVNSVSLQLCRRHSSYTSKQKGIFKHIPLCCLIDQSKISNVTDFLCIRQYSQLPHGQRPRGSGDETRRQTLWILTLVSGFIGVCLLTAISFQQYNRMAKKSQGMEELKIREYGRRPFLFRYRGFVLCDYMLSDPKSIHSFNVREDDTWVVSFPKAGTTWVQEIVYLISTDLDFVGAKAKKIDDRFPYFEFVYPGKQAISAMPSPRLIKSHLPFSLLPNQISEKKPKIIYIMRNPKDTAVSFYNFAVKFLAEWNRFLGTFEQYCELFTEDLVPYGPWWKHVLEAWKHSEDDNVLLLSYENLHQDPCGTVRKIASFLNKSLTDAQVNAVVEHCSFRNMKENQAVNYTWLKSDTSPVDFMRKGQIGDWKNHLSAEIVEKLDKMVSSKLTPAGLVIQDTLEEEAEGQERSL